MKFYKYQGTGNDFILIDDRAENFPVSEPLIARLCDRHFGIGADGLILLRDCPGYDFRMVYFNADGAEGSMCGNGGRCIVRFAHDLGLFESQVRFLAVDGEHVAQVNQDDIHLKMGNVKGLELQQDFAFLNTGSPHVVCLVENIQKQDVVRAGRQIRYDSRFAPGGTNVNFMEPLASDTLFVRTYERGVEAETYSCGTGVTAAALVASRQLGMRNPVTIHTLGGNLRVSFVSHSDGSFDSIYLIGPAVQVFTGSISLY